MTEKFDKFKAALEALCREHGVLLSGTEYEGIAVHNLESRERGCPIYCDWIEDETGRPAPQVPIVMTNKQVESFMRGIDHLFRGVP